MTRRTGCDGALPMASRDVAHLPGHWLFARLGKRVLRPGGRELTEQMPTDASVDAVIGEAMLTMQTDAHKAEIVAEAFRVLRPGGRYAIHELALTPDGVDDFRQD